MADKVHNGRAPGGCDICSATNAPFGFQPPGGARNLKQGQRPLRACRNQACRDAADLRLQKSLEVVRGSPQQMKLAPGPQGVLI